MKTKLICLLLFFGNVGFAQSIESLKVRALKIHDANFTMDFEPLADLTYPATLTQLGGNAKFLAKLDNDYQNESFRKRIQLEKPTAMQFGEIKTIGAQKFCVISYYNPMRYFYEKPLDAESGPKTAADLKVTMLATQTTYEPKRNSINVRRNSKFIAISDDTTNHEWKFINLDDIDERKTVDSVLNENIKKELGL